MLIFCQILTLSPKFSLRVRKLEFPVAWCLIDAASLQLCDVFTDAVVMEYDTRPDADLVSSWPMLPTLTAASQLFPIIFFLFIMKGLVFVS